jgi:cytochrome c5
VKVFLCGAAVCLAVSAQAQPAVEKNYQATCSACHDGGMGDAPRIDAPKAWEARLAQGRLALYQSALKGKPNTAMAAKGGFTQLSDAEVRDLVDYMLLRLGAPAIPLQPSQNWKVASMPAALPKPATSALTDAAISQAVAQALQSHWREQSTAIETREESVTVRGLGIQIRTNRGVATLSGTVQDPAQVQQAETLARAVVGVRQVTNRLIAASLFEWD